MRDYASFLFDEEGNLKARYAPVISYQTDTKIFILKYSIPGYHSPRQYFYFSEIPTNFPNQYVEDIFSLFAITESLLFRHPKKTIPKPRIGAVRSALNIPAPIRIVSPEDEELANYNMQLAIRLGRTHHSLFYFDAYLDAYRTLHPEIRYTQSVIRSIQASFNKLIS